MKIRKCRKQDAERLSQIAFAAKAHWKYPAEWLEIWRDGLTITPEFINNNEVYAMRENDEIVGFYALSSDAKTAKLEHLWIQPENTGTGIGRNLFAHALEKAAALKTEKIQIESDPNAEDFYVKMGAKRIGESVSQINDEKRILPLMQIIL